MANWSDLKASVAEVIKTNGNQEITGAVLQSTLNTIISNVGENATFAGVATPSTNPETPDGNVFYLASQSGVYSNFGGLTLSDDLYILVNNGINWKSIKLNIDNIISTYVYYITINKYIYKGTGKETDFTNLCYLTIPYTNGDNIEVFNAVRGVNYNNYNFFNGDTFISDSNTLESIPESTTKILANGSMRNLPYAIINGKPYGIYASSKKSIEDIAGINEDIAGINEDIAGINEDIAGINEDIAGINEDIAGCKAGKFISKDDGSEATYSSYCYMSFPYSDGDVIEVMNAVSAAAFNRYNFFENDNFILSSQELTSIPKNCNIIKVNGKLSNPPAVYVNGKGVNIYSENYRINNEVTELNNEVTGINDELSNLNNELFTILTSLITDYGASDLFSKGPGPTFTITVNENAVYNISVVNNSGANYCYVRPSHFDMDKVNVGRRVAFYVDVEFVKFPEAQATYTFGMVKPTSRKVISVKQGDRIRSVFKTEYNSANIDLPTLFLFTCSSAVQNEDWEYNLYQLAVIDCGTDSSNPLYDLSEDEILGILGNNPKINGPEIKVLKSSQVEGITRNSNGFTFEDEDENIVAILNKDRLQVKDVRNLQGGDLFLKAKLAGKEFFVVGDSLSSAAPTSNWIGKFAELTGATFNSDFNHDNISVGSTQTLGASIYSGQNRLKKLLEEKTPEIIILENINDFTTNVGDSDYSYMIGTTTISDTEYNDASSARSAKATEINSIPSPNRSIGHALRIGYVSQNGKKLIITGTATTAKTATVRVGSTSASINIENGDTAANVIAKIYEVYWANYDKFTDNSTYVAFVNSDGGAADVGLNNLDGNGITVTQDTYASTSYVNYYYIGQSTDDDTFKNSSNWTEIVPISAVYKGIFEYIYSKLPNCRVIWFIPTRIAIQWTEDGNGWDENLWLEKGVRVNMNYYKNTYSQKVNYDIFRKFQREVAELYGVEVYDINEECGINPINHKTFYPSYNVHPLQAGYDRWGETLAKMLKS